MAGETRVHVHRSERKPLYVQVLTAPPIRGCWSVNVSQSGIGLIASPETAEEGPKEGEEVELEFTLPGARTRIRVTGTVRWRHDAQERRGSASTAIGVHFKRFESSDQIKLAQYLLDHRMRVVVAYATRAAEDALRAALKEEVEVLHVASPEEIEAALQRGDVSAFVVYGERESPSLEVLAGALASVDEAHHRREGPSGLAPPFVYWAPARAEELVALFNTGRLFRALPPDSGGLALREAVLGACRQHGIRIEQRRMALELERHQLRERARAGGAPAPVAGDGPGFESPGMRRVMALVRLVAPHRVAVLLQGETGTGKEVLARTVHRLSTRSAAAIVVQDCGALPETLLESELFGHVKGAFTGAVADHPGLFVLADGGTIFLDEIENTTANLQAKLLRVIETGEVRPVGGKATRQVDVRIIAASNRALEDEVREGRFRSDLYYRLNTFVIDVPPLRQRREDVLPLARHFVAQLSRGLKRRVAGLSGDAESLLLRFDWRGNIRELRNVIERAVLLVGDGEQITPSQFPDALVARALAATADDARARPGYAEQMAQAEREILRAALERCEGVLRRAAQELKMDPVTLGRRARKLGLHLGRAAGSAPRRAASRRG